MAGWDKLENLIYEEIIQLEQEGYITTGYREKAEACGGDNSRLMEVYHELRSLKISPDYQYNEPNDFDEISALSEGVNNSGFKGSADELFDRMEGAWLGRCIGCALGKPFEAAPYVCGGMNKEGHVHIKKWLEGADAYPLRNYVPGKSRAQSDDLQLIAESSHLENIAYMETDDDIRYLVIGLIMSEKFGNDFTPDQLAEVWHELLPVSQCCTAERQAYINSINTEIADDAERLRYIQTWLNPYREWIGAQIRVDHYAYANAGFILDAAKTAYNDAIFSHVKNGVYGAIYVSALIAAAFTTSEPLSCVKTALGAVPKTSRLYEAILQSIEIANSSETAEEMYTALWKAFGKYNWVHTINNAAAITASMIFGEGDFTETLAATVCCGWDTDCNGATVGSVMGAMYGAKAIPEHWTKPLNDTLYSFIPGFHPITISECARRSVDVWNKLHK